MAFVEADIANYFTDYGVDATVGGVACRGIFDEAYAETFGFVGGSSPALLLPSSVAAAEGTAVVIGARNFTVTSVEPDGTGFQRLRLEAA